MKTLAVIPAYNESRTIREVVEGALPYVDGVIVVDDGSTDGTAERAGETPAEVIVQPRNMGKAEALRRGFREARDCDVVVTLDADLQHCPDEIPKLVECIEEGADLCIGSRFLGKGGRMPMANRISNAWVRFVMGLLAGQRLTDPQSGFRAIRREALDEMELPAERYAVEHIMILEAARKRFKIKEVPISCVYGEETSHINPIRDTFHVVKSIVSFMLRSGR
ncbi:MAG: glycosyltransferase family 2 protein [Euryarchaeota archaeon]|nr:glycosyltransferase family 2 protein [Euryarchaeota archaeon]